MNILLRNTTDELVKVELRERGGRMIPVSIIPGGVMDIHNTDITMKISELIEQGVLKVEGGEVPALKVEDRIPPVPEPAVVETVITTFKAPIPAPEVTQEPVVTTDSSSTPEVEDKKETVSSVEATAPTAEVAPTPEVKPAEEKKAMHKCDQCEQEFATPQALAGHKRSAHKK